MKSPPAKRQRTDDDASSEITRVEKFWFKDGNIILQVESSQYRVHKSLLALHSSVFKNMFDVPQPEHAKPLVEGCQVVHLFDSAQDMEHILSLIYEGFQHEGWDESETSNIFSLNAAMIRLGRKYDFTRFQTQALRRLQIRFPKKFKHWLKQGDIFNPAYLFNVINLAHEISITTILPGVYMDVFFQCSMEEILQGAEDFDDKLVRLNPHSMELCIIGREKVLHHLPRFIFPWFSSEVPFPVPCEPCPVATRCKQSFMEFMRQLWCYSTELGYGADLLADLPADLSSFCAECKATIMIEYEKGRADLWNALPGYLGLPEWDDLKDFETA